MQVYKIHSYLINAGKGVDVQNEIKGTELTSTSGGLFKMLTEIFENAHFDCPYEIAFKPSENGEQKNECRDIIINYIKNQSLEEGLKIGRQLQKVTTKRSGLGLLFLICGENQGKKRFIISRFPADNGVLAEEGPTSLTVEYVEKVFMKSARAYKAAFFEGNSFDSEFWSAKAIDKQISGDLPISEYWITDFLISDFAVQGARGSRNLANALKSAINNAKSIEVKEELTAAMTLAKGMNGQVISAESFFNRLGVSKEAKDFIQSFFKEGTFTQQFKLNYNEVKKQIAYKTVQLNTGAYLSATTEDFDKVFQKSSDSESNEVIYSTRGKIVSQKVKKSQ